MKDEPEPEELTLAYMSIDTMSARIKNLEIEIRELESENKRLKTAANSHCPAAPEPHRGGLGWSSNDDDDYDSGPWRFGASED